jgi:hypothetical protein
MGEAAPQLTPKLTPALLWFSNDGNPRWMEEILRQLIQLIGGLSHYL